MFRGRRHRLVPLGVGTGTGGALYWLGIDFLLVSAIAVALAVSVALLLRITREFPERRTGDGWQDSRWTAVSLLVTNFAALVGIRSVSLPGGYGAAVSFLIIFVGLSAYLSGSLAEMERDRLGDARTEENEPVSGDN